MQKLKKFRKNKKIKVKILVLGIFGVMLSLLIGKSYAIYQRNTEVTFINAKVRWPKANEISYTTKTNTEITNVEQALNELYRKLGE